MSLLRRNRRKDRVPDAAYLDFIRSLRCVCCQTRELRYAHMIDYQDFRFPIFLQTTRTESSHTGPHALGSKADDLTAIPLCGFEHHREGQFSYHKMGEKAFLAYWGIDLPKLIEELHSQFAASRGCVLSAHEVIA